MPDSILSIDDLPAPEATALRTMARAARSDWRAAAWLLERSPLTREQWSEYGRNKSLLQGQMARTLKAIEKTSLSPQVERSLILNIIAEGCILDIEPETDSLIQGAD